MISIDENIKPLERAVLDEARAEAEKILAEARMKAETMKRQASERAADERARIIAQASLEAERLRSQAIAITHLESRTLTLEQREILLQTVFEAVRKKLPKVQRDPHYDRIAQNLLREALLQLGAGSARLHADKATQKVLTASLLEKMSKGLKIRIQKGEPLKDGIGVIVETEDGRRQYDNTLETRLNRMQDALRSPVYRLLMGETQ